MKLPVTSSPDKKTCAIHLPFPSEQIRGIALTVLCKDGRVISVGPQSNLPLWKQLLDAARRAMEKHAQQTEHPIQVVRTMPDTIKGNGHGARRA